MKRLLTTIAVLALTACSSSAVSGDLLSGSRAHESVIQPTQHSTETIVDASIVTCAGQNISGTLVVTFTFGAAGASLEHVEGQSRFTSDDGHWYSFGTTSGYLTISPQVQQSNEMMLMHLFKDGHPVELDHLLLHVAFTPDRSFTIEHASERCAL